MNYSTVNGKRVSKITLGTVQLGLNYGIANSFGQPNIEKSHNMLNCAIDNGIVSFDTARDYGTSEDVLGSYFGTRKTNDDLFITSKLIVDLPKTATEYEIEKKMNACVETSLEKLQINKLDCLMLHRGEEVTKYGEYVPKILEKLVVNGLIGMAGVSVYSGEELDSMILHDVFRATQLPMNIFDQKLIYNGYIDMLHKKNISIFVRSVFLQGLFFLNPNTFNDPILEEYVKPFSVKLEEYCERTGMSMAEMAISFIRDIPGVTSLVLGADNEEHILNNVNYINAPEIDENTRDNMYTDFKDVNIKKIMQVLSRSKD